MDGQSDPVVVGNVAKQLIAEGAVAIIAPSDFDFGGPASREAQAAGMVGLSPCASSPLYSSTALGDKQFTMSMWNTTMGAVMAEYAYNELGYRTVYVITDDFIDYTKSLSKYFIEAFEEIGGEVLFEDTYTQGQADASAQVARIKDLPEPPDFVYVSSYMPDLALIIRTLRESGIDVPVVGGDSYDDPALFEALGASTARRSTSTPTATCLRKATRTTRTSRRHTWTSTARSPTPCGSSPAMTPSWCSRRPWSSPAAPTVPRWRRPWRTTPSSCSPVRSTGATPPLVTSPTRPRLSWNSPRVSRRSSAG